jgi:orotate phosphoribosyltransferase
VADANGTLLKLIHETQAVSVWNRQTGPVFWYAAGVPGPFYVNTERVIGPAVAQSLLDKINAILAASNDPATRMTQLDEAMLAAVAAHPAYRHVITALAAKAREEFPAGTFAAISGGERRDWLFSIPLARELGIRHIYLFKNGTHYCAETVKPGEKILHVSDLINNAASYFDLWLPILQKAQMPCVGTLCVNSRGSNGVKKLEANGQKVVALNSIDIGFFAEWLKNGLIDQATYDELATFFASAEEWGRKYLTTDVRLFEVARLDAKSFERLRSFFAQDPWAMRKGHENFFRDMEAAIAAKRTAAA